MANKISVAAAMRSSKWNQLGDEISKLEAAGVDVFHFDAADGNFIDDFGVGCEVIKSVRTFSKLPIEIHMMIERPERHIEKYAAAGADILIVHPESTRHLHRVLGDIRTLGLKPALSLNPGTPFESIRDVILLADKISVMTVNPGVGGKFVESVLPKIKSISNFIKKEGLEVSVQADGGVSLKTREILLKSGVTSFVVGYPIFSRDDYSLGVKEIKTGKNS